MCSCFRKDKCLKFEMPKMLKIMVPTKGHMVFPLLAGSDVENAIPRCAGLKKLNSIHLLGTRSITGFPGTVNNVLCFLHRNGTKLNC